MRDTLRRLAIRGWQFISTTWLIVGISLALLLLAESCYRLQGAARSALRGSSATSGVADPQAGFDWFEQYQREEAATQKVGWKPYVYFRRVAPYSGQYVHIDSLAHRVTPQPSTPAVPAARVFLFGGSTIWGTSQRDDHTIAAEMARRLQTVAGPGARIEVTNFGETGYVFTQEIFELQLQLRTGNRPDVVVFIDGINDVAALVQNGIAGDPQNERNRVADFQLGRSLDQGGRSAGLGKDLRAFGALALKGLGELEVMQRIQMFAGSRPPLIAADSGIHALARNYAENVRLVEALAREYGFTAIYVWQPSLQASPKRLTPFEERLMRGIDGDPAQHRMKEIHKGVPARLDSALATVVPGRFVNTSALFSVDTLSVFTDVIGHNTEASVPAIVDGFWLALGNAAAERVRTSVQRRP